MVISNMSMSVMAISIAAYIGQLVPWVANNQTLFAFLIMTVFFAASIKGTKFLSRIQNVMVVCMYGALALFVIFGVTHRDPAVASDPFLPNGIIGLLTAVAMMSYTCNGAAGIVNLSGDANEPTKNVPKAMLLTVAVAGIIYALLGYAATASLPYGEVAGQNLGFVAQKVMPSGLYIFFIVGGAIFALATTLLGTVSALKWPIVSSAKDGWLPAVFTKETTNGFPWVVMLMMYLIGVIPILGGFSLESIVSLMMVPGAINSIFGNIINWNLPKKFPKAWAGNTLHLTETGWHILLIISTICCCIISGFSLSTQSLNGIVANLGMTVFLFAYGYLRYKSGKVHLAARDVYSE